jgi:hypothetical protein
MINIEKMKIMTVKDMTKNHFLRIKAFLLFSPFFAMPSCAKEVAEINSENMLKAATVKDFISLEVIPIPEIWRKDKGAGVKNHEIEEA